MNIRVGVVQMSCTLDNKNANMEAVQNIIDQAAQKGIRLLAFPELFTTGYRTDSTIKALAETIPGPTTQYLQVEAKKNNMYLSGAILEHIKALNCFFITAFVIGPKGIVGTYRKTGLWGQEKDIYKRGGQYSVCRTQIATFGLHICYEIGFPEIARYLAMNGAQILLCPSAFGMPRRYVWEIATRSRSLENGVFLVAAARSGTDLDKTFAGCSRIVAPNGSVIAEAQADNELIIADLDLSWIERQREAVPYLQDLDALSLCSY